jgi:uncharacterized membrane protein YoaK (UPF0700 family)
MLQYSRSFRLFAFCYAALAGFVDAIGFLKSGGLFVSFMTGNSTRLAVSVARLNDTALAALALIMLFVFGVLINALISSSVVKERCRPVAAAVVSSLLISAASFETLGFPYVSTGLLCMAMGAANVIFQRSGDVGVGVTYMTGTLVRLGYRLADALRGGDRFGWIPSLLLWFALVGGAIAGAIGFFHSVLASLWLSAAVSVGLAGFIQGLAEERSRATPSTSLPF